MKNYTEQEKLAIELYVNQKRGQQYVCKQTKMSVKQLKNFLTQEGIHIRTFSEAAIASNKNRAMHKNIDYFKTENANMAWLLGFLAADGSIRKDENEIKIGLSIVDKEILEKIKKELELETEVKEYITNQGYQCCKLQWTCQEHKEDLATYGIIPQKTFQLVPPYKLNKKYWIDYIRGYFDGDGSVNSLQNGTALRWQICSATKEILEFIINYFYEEYNIPKVNILKKDNTYYFQYSTNATKQIYKYLYSTNSLYLQRKKDKYDTLMI